MNYRELIDLFEKGKRRWRRVGTETNGVVVGLDVEGRLFGVMGGEVINRVNPEAFFGWSTRDKYLNPGGHGLWPAPEGGKVGFNYVGNSWYVQDAVSNQPYEAAGPAIEKKVTLINRLGTNVEATIRREVTITPGVPRLLEGYRLKESLCYAAADSIRVLNPVTTEQALIAAWTLEQFDATDQTVSFGRVDKPDAAINYDFYDHPGKRIAGRKRGFTYQTDGRCRGQIGIKTEARAAGIGFYDFSRNLLCLRENRNDGSGLFFNIADNDQPDGPFSAADNYSIFNSPPDLPPFFELETIGSARVEHGKVSGSELVSVTCFAVFENAGDMRAFIEELL